jgi:peptide-methionine (S)-S-oxide reductase
MPQKDSDSIVLGGGCFWCLDALYSRLKGVTKVESGYAGGDDTNFPNPTYYQVFSKKTGHAEVVRINFNPLEIKLSTLVDIFWAIHDPTALNRQGADVGNDYRSIILYNSKEQKQIIEGSLKNVGQPLWPDPIVTELKPLTKFYPAEPEHQDFAAKNPSSTYCNIVINPKITKFKQQFASLLI